MASKRTATEEADELYNSLHRKRPKHGYNPTPKLTPDEYKAKIQTLNTTNSGHNDAHTTIRNLNGIFRKWVRFCVLRQEFHWKAALEACDKGVSKMFLYFICERCNVRAFNTVHIYLLEFKQLYNRVVRKDMDKADAKDVYQYLDSELAAPAPKGFNLRREKTAKPVLGSDDLLLLLTHHWARDTSAFPTEHHRLMVATIMLLLSYTGCRPGELVDAMPHKNTGGRRTAPRPEYEDDDRDSGYESGTAPDDSPVYDHQQPWTNPDDPDYSDDVATDNTQREYKALCYEDICLWIVRNPTTGRDCLAMEITLSHHKGADKKPKPTTFFFVQQSLPILCPISHILALAIKDDAINVKGCDHAEPFFSTKLPDHKQALLVRWKPEWMKKPIFRQPVRTYEGVTVSKHRALRYSMFVFFLVRLGWLAGLAMALTCYCFRRGTGNAVDGATTKAVRDQVMRHNPQTGVFCGSYLNEKVRVVVQDAVLDQPTDRGLLRAFTHMSLTADPRAPKGVPDAVFNAMPPDPDIEELRKEREEYHKIYGKFTRAPKDVKETCETLRRRIDSLKKQRRREMDIEYRRSYFDRIHDEELERQLKRGKAVKIVDKYVEPVVQHQLSERTKLQSVMCDLSELLCLKALADRWIRAIDLMVALSHRVEVSCRNRSSMASERSRTPFEKKQKLPQEELYIPPEELFPMILPEKKICIFCLGDVRLTYEQRTRTFATPNKMMNHVEEHLKRKRGPIDCPHPICRSEALVLNDVVYFKSHVLTEHKIKLRDPRYV